MKRWIIFLAFFTLFFLQKNIAQDTVKFIRVNYHFMLKNDSTGNFNVYWDGLKDSAMTGYQRAINVIEKANFELAHNKRMFRPEGNRNAIKRTNMQYVLCGVYFHYDDSVYSNDVFAGWDMLDKYGVNPKTEINIFNIPDGGAHSGIATEIPRPDQTDLILATKVKDYDKYSQFPPWSIQFQASNVNHEIGHLLGLYHTWNSDDFCDDTPMGVFHEYDYTQCWGYREGHPVCGKWANISNNIMDYNEMFPRAYTPCQLETVHNILNTAAKDYIAKIDKYAPPKAYFDIILDKKANRVWFEGSPSWNETSYTLDIFENKKRKSVLSFDEKEGVEKLNLSEYYAFKKGSQYRVVLTVFSKIGEMDKVEKVFVF